MERKIGVLGGGVSGLTFASLVKDSEVLEKEEEFGGLLRSVREEGYTFDLGSHIIFSKNDNVLKFILNLLKGNVIKHKRNTKIYYKNNLVKYPFENGLGDLSKEEAYECAIDYAETYLKREKNELKKPENFKEWMDYRFGKAITEKYLYPYNCKVWDYPLEKMDIFWVEGRVPQPPLRDVIKAAIGLGSEGYTHQLNFYYPKNDGFQAISDAIKGRIDNKRLINKFDISKIKKEDKKWAVKGTEERIYNKIVTTIHVRDFINIYNDVPKSIKEAANSLRWNSLYLIMIGIKKPKISDLHWVYIPAKEVLPNRISFPSNLSSNNVPYGHSSVLAEITFDPNGEKARMKEKNLIEMTIEDLHELKVFNKKDVEFMKLVKCRYAYPIYDLEYQRNIKLIEEFAKKEGIVLLGRFSEFKYYNSDKCIENAMEKAKYFSGC